MVSGLPASGKTTLAKALARAFDLPLLDKDDILEALFDALGTGDAVHRQRLSRASDAVLAKLASESRGAVLCSFWRHQQSEGESGTPWQWLQRLGNTVIEVHCTCPADLAVQRFLGRSRHPGHNDSDRREEALILQFQLAAERGPLGAGPLVVVDTSRPWDIAAVVRMIKAAAPSARA